MSDIDSSSNPLIHFWMKSASDMWKQSVKQMAGFREQAADTGTTAFKLKSVPKRSASEKQENSAGPEEAWREMIDQMARNTFNGFLKMQSNLFAKSTGMETFFDPLLFESAANRLHASTLESFEQELRKIMQMPALGLTRFYQEKINRAWVKYEDFRNALSRFMRLFSRPFETSLAEFRKMVAELSEADRTPKNLYKRWIKRLETDFMSLYKSPQYLEAMSGALSAYEEFAHARNAVCEDLLKNLPIPTNSDMDELYKEIYQLKKRLKELEKQVKPLRSVS